MDDTIKPQDGVPDAPNVLRRLRAYVERWWLPGLHLPEPRTLWMRLIEAPKPGWYTFWFAKVSDTQALMKLLNCQPNNQKAAKIALMRVWQWKAGATYACLEKGTMVEIVVPTNPTDMTYELLDEGVVALCSMTGEDPACLRTNLLEEE